MLELSGTIEPSRCPHLMTSLPLVQNDWWPLNIPSSSDRRDKYHQTDIKYHQIYIYTLYHYLNVIFCRRRFFSVHGGFMDRRIPPRSESSIETSEVTHNSAISACSNAREWQMALALSQERERNWLGWIFISSSWYSMIQPFWECPSHDISWIPGIDPGAVF